jgi:hypothetical protein
MIFFLFVISIFISSTKTEIVYKDDEINGKIFTDDYCSVLQLRLDITTEKQIYSNGMIDPCSNKNFEEQYLIQKHRRFDCGYIVGERTIKDGVTFDFFYSGVTIGIGIDLLKYNKEALRNFNISTTLIQKLEPYLELGNKEAYSKLSVLPLYLTLEEENELTYKVLNEKYNQLSSFYNSKKCYYCENFSWFPISLRTVIFAAYYQEEFGFYWDDILNNNWENLRDTDKISLTESDRNIVNSYMRNKTKSNIVFNIDASGRITQDEFNKTKEFVLNYIKSNINLTNNFAIVTYSSNVDNVINFNSSDVFSKLENLQYKGEETGTGNDFEALQLSVNLFNNSDNSSKMIVYFTNGLIDISNTYQARKYSHEKSIVIVPVSYNGSFLNQVFDMRYNLKFGDQDKLNCMQENIPYPEFNISENIPLKSSLVQRLEFYDKPKYYYTKSFMNQSLNVTIKVLRKEINSEYTYISLSDSYNTNHTIGKNTSFVLSHNNTNSANRFEFILGSGCADCLSSRISFINVISSGLEYSIDVNNCTDCKEGVYVYEKEKSSSLAWLWVTISLVIFMIIGVVYIIWRHFKKSKIGKEEDSYVSMNL